MRGSSSPKPLTPAALRLDGVGWTDTENQLTNVQVTASWKSEFRYDGKMRMRIRREYTSKAGVWVQTNECRYVYDGNLVLQERDGNNVPQVTYTRGTDLGGSLEGAGGIGGLLARTDHASGSHAYYHADGNGNISMLLNGQSVPVARYLYDPFGNLLAMAGPLAEPNKYRFSSKEAHPNSGLLYYLYRFYDPNLQRWINRDPIEEEGGVNLYAFCAGDPISSIDASGLEPSSSPRCQRLLRKIMDNRARLEGKLRELAKNSKGLPQSAPGDDLKPSLSIDGHLRMNAALAASIARDEAEYSATCSDPEPPGCPLPVPVPAPVPAPVRTGPPPAACAAAAVGGGYIAYRCLRMLPSLLAPPTIPLNLAIP